MKNLYAPLLLFTQRYPEHYSLQGRATDILMTQARLLPYRNSLLDGKKDGTHKKINRRQRKL